MATKNVVSSKGGRNVAVGAAKRTAQVPQDVASAETSSSGLWKFKNGPESSFKCQILCLFTMFNFNYNISLC